MPHGHLLLAHHLPSQQVDAIASCLAGNPIPTHLCCTSMSNRLPSSFSINQSPSSPVPTLKLRAAERFSSFTQQVMELWLQPGPVGRYALLTNTTSPSFYAPNHHASSSQHP